MTRTSKNLPDQTAAARSSRRSSRRRPDLRKTRDTALPAGKISLKPAAKAPPANAFAERKRRSRHRPDTAPTAIPHSAVTQQNRPSSPRGFLP
jgi:hypothetical protein